MLFITYFDAVVQSASINTRHTCSLYILSAKWLKFSLDRLRCTALIVFFMSSISQAKAHALDGSGYTPLQLAALRGHASVCGAMARVGASLAKSVSGRTPASVRLKTRRVNARYVS